MQNEKKTDKIEKLLNDCDFILPIRMAWGEMDAFQHLNNVVYFRYLESTRIAFFESRDFVREGRPLAIGPILASTSCKFLVPMTYPDTAHVGLKVSEIGDDRFTLEYAIVSEKLKKITAVGEAMIVSYDYEKMQKVNLPEEWKEKLAAG